MIQKFLHSAKGGRAAALLLILFAFYDSKPAERLADGVCFLRGKLCGIGPVGSFWALMLDFRKPTEVFCPRNSKVADVQAVVLLDPRPDLLVCGAFGL